MYQFHKSWCIFATQTLGIDVRPHELVLVSGWVKTSHCAMTAFDKIGKKHSFSFSASGASFLAASFKFSGDSRLRKSHWHHSSASETMEPRKAGAHHRNQRSSQHTNCVFVRYYKAKWTAPFLERPLDVVEYPVHARNCWQSVGYYTSCCSMILCSCHGAQYQRAVEEHLDAEPELAQVSEM